MNGGCTSGTFSVRSGHWPAHSQPLRGLFFVPLKRGFFMAVVLAIFAAPYRRPWGLQARSLCGPWGLQAR